MFPKISTAEAQALLEAHQSIARLAPEIQAAAARHEHVIRDMQRGGFLNAVAEAEQILRRASDLLAPADPPEPAESLEPSFDEGCDGLADRIRSGRMRTMRALALEHRPFLERHGKLRPESEAGTAVRRFQKLCAAEIYGKRIPEEALPPRIRSGRATGGRRPGLPGQI